MSPTLPLTSLPWSVEWRSGSPELLEFSPWICAHLYTFVTFWSKGNPLYLFARPWTRIPLYLANFEYLAQ
jgi:hypothetical protein